MEEINFIRPQEVYNRSTGESKVRYTSYDGGNRFIPVVEGEDGVPKTLTKVTYQELKDKRDAGKLIPGALYRITDYQCTTTQENTRSAGHQFDIVLLALSENKLAEEGWAMMNESNIYDVTFSDGVTKKCYLYEIDRGYHVIDISTLLGYAEDNIEINETNKTAITDNPTDDLIRPNLTYNYFQNSNLSAWKVWYCLDNDKSRFAWAQKSKIMYKPNPFDDAFEVYVSNNTRIYDSKTYYACLEKTDNQDVNLYVLNKDVNVNMEFYTFGGASGQEQPFVASSVTIEPEGTGVIYRLIDEWNNDVPYDFKNIQFKRPMTDGIYDPDGEDTWVYTFTNTNDGVKDASFPYYREDLKFSVVYAVDNYIDSGFDSSYYLLNNVFIGDDIISFNKLYCFTTNNTCLGSYNTIMYGTADKDDVESSSIYIGDKKVLTEDALDDIETALNNI